MTALNANVNASQEWLPLSQADSLSLADGYYTIDTENVKVENGPHPAGSTSRTTYNGRRAQRGVGGSTAASHLSGATLTRYYPDAVSGEGGGGVTVDNTVDAPFAASTLVVPGATESAPDEATLTEGLTASDGTEVIGITTTLYISPTEPPAQGDAGNMWLQTDPNNAATLLALFVWIGDQWQQTGAADGLNGTDVDLNVFDVDGEQLARLNMSAVTASMRAFAGSVNVQASTSVTVQGADVYIVFGLDVRVPRWGRLAHRWQWRDRSSDGVRSGRSVGGRRCSRAGRFALPPYQRPALGQDRRHGHRLGADGGRSMIALLGLITQAA